MNALPAARSIGRLPRFAVANGSLEALKWVALLLMVGDHVNKYLFNEDYAVLFALGRIAMPIFVFVLAYNLARPSTLERGVYSRVMGRLAVFGVLATPAFIALGGLLWGWYPLNILFTLLVLAAVLQQLDVAQRGQPRRYLVAGAIGLVGGGLVGFWWPAVAFGVAVWYYARHPSTVALVVALVACTSLVFVNGNAWALAALPLIVLASRVHVTVPRMKWVFYAFYPLHLLALWLIRIPMSHAGYLFFT